ncbi:M48 family metalloprotease [Synechococcales cyanobacterium C]|uniref:M48 family metalloprotease n=1 Tax=Petrachloros mirabilis ULC683 TaxID=2781853 RepID=A0A8K2A0L7_9CYAN|nr:M48 family metallopeptidase [Petrachloros mirabilis]NCJ07572.1 M48 family metalloprotease [Petrachloros mirabilis ULC683]
MNSLTAKTSLIGLKSNQFRHPLDLEATAALKQLPGLDWLVRALLGSMAEQIFYLDNIAASVLVSEQQLPELDHLLRDACQILDLEVPQLYVRQHPMPNAYTFAMRGKQPFIVVHTSLLDLLEPGEIQAVLAHELGHLKCEHGVYLTLANLIMLAAGQLPRLGEVLAQSLQAQILAWVRCAEFTCDRAGLLVTQDAKVMASVLMKLAGGSPKLAPLLNVDAFIAQARAYDHIDDELGLMIKELRSADLTHPLPVLRAREIDRWAHSREYLKLLQNHSRSTEAGIGWRHW